jgi:hypothetical protein
MALCFQTVSGTTCYIIKQNSYKTLHLTIWYTVKKWCTVTKWYIAEQYVIITVQYRNGWVGR